MFDDRDKIPKSNWYENRWKSLRREKCPLPRPPQKAALKRNKKGEKSKKGREMRRYERTRPKLGKKRIEKREKKGESRVTSIGRMKFPLSYCPSPSVLRASWQKGQEERAKSGGRAPCTRTHTTRTRVLQVARVIRARVQARETLLAIRIELVSLRVF